MVSSTVVELWNLPFLPTKPMTSLKELKEIYQTINEIIKGGISERNAFFSIKYLFFFVFF